MGTKPVYKTLRFEQSGVTDKVQKISQRKTEDSGLLCCDAVSLGQFPEIFKDP
jgi:hypothetical protein